VADAGREAQQGGVRQPLALVAAGPYEQPRSAALVRAVLTWPVLALGALGLGVALVLVLVDGPWALLRGRGSVSAGWLRRAALACWAGAGAYAFGLTPWPTVRAEGTNVALGLAEQRADRRAVLRFPGGLVALVLGALLWLGSWPFAVLGWLWLGLRGRLPGPLHVALACALRIQVRAAAVAAVAPVAWPRGVLGDRPGEATRRFGFAEPWPDAVVYAGVRVVWGYDATRLVCGCWPRPGTKRRAELWPLERQREAWARFRRWAPDGVPAELLRVVPAPPRPAWQDGVASRLVVVAAVFALLGVGGGVAAAQQAAAAGQEAAASRAGSQLAQAYAELDRAVGTYETETVACRGASQPLPCVTAADRTAVAAFAAFAHRVSLLAVPAGAAADRRALVADAVLAQRAFGRLAVARSVGAYERTVAAADLGRVVAQVESAVTRLEAQLASAA
jgi:hypothetical protein